ncbi:MAG: DNA topoisomerase IB [Betaproteobacteria bacterium]|nr:MAG: DNA topoisomerase IB [Betaproteobacteria bacterium]
MTENLDTSEKHPPHVAEHRKTASRSGLNYVTDGVAGITRRRAGKGWAYYYPDGTRITDREERRRIGSLAIPPAWTDVWICPDPKGHIQATARDARGRKQYRYHTTYREARDHSKFRRMLEFSEVLPSIRERVERDLRGPDMSRRQILAATVRLLDKTLIRVGNDEYAKGNRSYGLTTLRRQHVKVDGSVLRFTFRGKSGVQQAFTVTDKRIARIVQRCQDLPGWELFKYVNGDGKRQTITSDDVNEYLRQVGGHTVSAKDFRTWGGTILAAVALREVGPAATKREATRNINRAIDEVAERLGNTRAVCRKYYIHPALLQAYMEGLTVGSSVPPSSNGAPSNAESSSTESSTAEPVNTVSSDTSAEAEASGTSDTQTSNAESSTETQLSEPQLSGLRSSEPSSDVPPSIDAGSSDAASSDAASSDAASSDAASSDPLENRTRRKRARSALRRDEVAVLQFLQELA